MNERIEDAMYGKSSKSANEAGEIKGVFDAPIYDHYKHKTDGKARRNSRYRIFSYLP